MESIRSFFSGVFSHEGESSFTTKSIPKRPFQVISIDGGGVRGIIPFIFIKKMMELTQLHLEPSDYFDMAIGTSSGGLGCTAFFCHKEEQPLFKASQLPEFWKDNVTKVFHETLLNDIETGWGFIYPKYQSKGLEAVIHTMVDDTMTLEQHFLKPTIITSFDATGNRPFYFAPKGIFQNLDEQRAKIEDLHIPQILRCTTAAPTYFAPEAIQVQENNGVTVPHAFVDGGLFANNPAVDGYAFASRLAGHTQVEVFSFGTGDVPQSLSYKYLSNAGKIKYEANILNLMFKGMETRPECVLGSDSYLRFQIDDLDQSDAALDNVKAIPDLEKRAEEWIRIHESELEQAARQLRARDPVDLHVQEQEIY